MLSVEDALRRVAAAFAPLPAEWVMLAAGRGRVLARDLRATHDQPPWPVSAMDGYAVRSADLASGAADLRVTGEAPAGRPFAGSVGPGEAVRIFTGGRLPDGADAVLIQEDAEASGGRVRVGAAVEPGAFVRPAGLDFRADELGLAAGRTLTPRDLGLAAAMGHVWLPVRRRPRVAVLGTGDELVLPGSALGPDRIVGSNNVTLAAMLAGFGADAVDLGIAADRTDSLAEAASAAAGCDLLVTSGGASVGDHDLVRRLLGPEADGGGPALDFWKIAMRPGKPLIFGRLGGVPLLGLPGNPASVGVCACLFVRAAARVMQGLSPEPPETAAVLGRDLGPNDRRQEYLRVSLRHDDDGRRVATPFPRQDSSMLALLARAEGLVVRPPFAPAMPAGTRVRLIALDGSALGV